MKNPSSVFLIKNDNFTINPNGSEFIEIVAWPQEEGVYHDQLLVAIENNPKILQINLQCRAGKVHFVINPSIVRFNRMVINATETVNVSLVNNSLITIFWKFLDVGIALKYFRISRLHGYIKPKSSLQVEFTLTPKSVGDIGPFRLIVQV